MNFKKKFYTEDFLNEFSLSNSDKTKLQDLIIDFLKTLEKHRFIYDKLTIVYKKVKREEEEFKIKNLTSLKIAQSKYIFFNERLEIPKFK